MSKCKELIQHVGLNMSASRSEPTRKKKVQRTLKESFSVRRSTRNCKAKDERQQNFIAKLRETKEEGLKVVEVEGKGRGVIATRVFRHGDFLCEYSGELITETDADEREQAYLKDPAMGCYMYFFQHRSKKWCVDATKDNSKMGRMVNHSKKHPNTTTKVIEVDGMPKLILLALRDIRTNEELVYDYGERRADVIKAMPWLAS